MAYLLVAYPQLKLNDYSLIQNFRKNNDELYFNVAEPHFTIVFPTSGISRDEFCAEVKTKSLNFTKFDFVIRCATINKDAFSNYFHAFLVPDEGYSRIIRLHDKIYSEKLKGELRLDLDYVPHINIGNSKDKFLCKKMADEWNEIEFSISGSISSLTIIKFENNIVTNLEEIELR